jgi:hypothetical protein
MMTKAILTISRYQLHSYRKHHKIQKWIHVIIQKGKIQEIIWKKNFGTIHRLDVTRTDEVEVDTTKRLIHHDFPSTDL